MTRINETYSAKRALELTGFGTVAMLDYLQRSKVFFPRGSSGRRGKGRARRYTFRDILILKAIKRLLDGGASTAALQRALEQFQKLNWLADPVTLEDKDGVIRYMIASGGELFLIRDPLEIISLSKKGQLAFSFLIDLERLHDELRSDLGLRGEQHEFSL